MAEKEISRDLLDVVPHVMRTIRSEMRGIASPELTVAQFRILARLNLKSHTNKQLAEWIGVSTAAMSRTIDGLVRRGLVQRKSTERDRREVGLCLTRAGRDKFSAIEKAAQKKLAKRIEKQSSMKRRELRAGLEALRDLFSED